MKEQIRTTKHKTHAISYLENYDLTDCDIEVVYMKK